MGPIRQILQDLLRSHTHDELYFSRDRWPIPDSWSSAGLREIQLSGNERKGTILCDNGVVPFKENSLTFWLHWYSLDNLKQRDLYMVMAEARRVLRKQGCFAIVSMDCQPGILPSLKRALGLTVEPWPAFEPTFFVSPEDWKTSQDITGFESTYQSRLLVLTKL